MKSARKETLNLHICFRQIHESSCVNSQVDSIIIVLFSLTGYATSRTEHEDLTRAPSSTWIPFASELFHFLTVFSRLLPTRALNGQVDHALHRRRHRRDRRRALTLDWIAASLCLSYFVLTQSNCLAAFWQTFEDSYSAVSEH